MASLSLSRALRGRYPQTLPVSRRDDRGGNSVTVQWFGANTNLHSVWDENLIEQEGLSFSENATFLDFVSNNEIKKLQNSG